MMRRKIFFKKKKKKDFKFRRKRFDSILIPIRKYKIVVAPPNFSLVDNIEEILDFIDRIESFYKNRESVFVHLQNIQKLGSGAVLLLLANMIRFKNQNIEFNGSRPQNKDLRKKLNQSGFFRHLYKIDGEKLSLGTPTDVIYTHAQKFVDAGLADKIIEEASLTVWGEKRRCPGVQRTLVELMHNTNNHAGSYKGEKHWWILSNRSSNNATVSISFMDFGIGIFDSLNHKKEGEHFYGWRNKIKSFFTGDISNDQLMSLILQGILHKTCTDESFRGKGLPGIYNAFHKGRIGRVIIISNDVYADLEKDEYRLLKHNLHGTFVSCEIKKDIFNLQWLDYQ